MTIKEVLDEFAKFIQYDPNQTRFNMLSANYVFHGAGKDIETLLSGYDPSGALSAMRARDALIEVAQNTNIPLYGWLTNPEVTQEMREYATMWQRLNDPEVLEQEDHYLNSMNETLKNSMGIAMIGDRDMEEERKHFLKSTMQVIHDLKKMRIDCYQNSGMPVSEVKKFHTRILVFERMSDCILHISNEPDAIYLCYISNHQSAGGYFAFLLKNNGNLIAFHDRVDEVYIGQHGNLRNGRWTDRHMDKLFPYDYIFHFENYDYKGYAGTYIIDQEKLDFIKLGVEVYQPLLVAMIILKNKYEGLRFEAEPLFLNTLMEQNFYLEHKGMAATELAVIEKNEIVIRNRQYTCTLETDKIMTDEGYNREFECNTHKVPWVALYGTGFKPDLSTALASCSRMQEDAYAEEFIGTQYRMDKQVYYEIRKQLAEYIKQQMQKELQEFGASHAWEYWNKKAKSRKDRFIDLICKKTYQNSHPETDWGEDTICFDAIKREDWGYRRPERVYNQNFKYHYNRSANDILDDYNGAKCSIFYQLDPHDWRTMEAFLGEPLPKIFQGFGARNCNGNSLLNVVDMVGELVCPLTGHFSGYSLCIGFSKAGWKKTYYDWLTAHGYGTEIERLETERKEALKKKKMAEQEKAMLPAKPYQPSDQYEQYTNAAELIQAERELHQVFPGTKLGVFGQDPDADSVTGKRHVIYTEITLPVKGNKDKFKQMEDLGWRASYISVQGGCRMQRFRYDFI